MSCFHKFCHLRFIFLWFAVILRTADGASITWYEPPPVETIADTAVTRTVDRNLTEGFMRELTWNFSLSTGSSIITVTVEYKSSTTVATYIQQTQTVTVAEGLRDRFNLTWIPTKATLIMFNVTSDDNEEFTCAVLSVDGSGASTWKRKIQVTVLVPAHITHISGNQTVIEGDEVTLNCTADGNPEPSITWRRLSDNSSVNMPLQNISRQDKGGYRCMADNGVGSPATKDTFITVQFPPNIVHISGNQNKSEGDKVTLNCTADGNPEPNITWTVGNIKKHFGSSFPLTITGKQDEGVYTCTADNGIGSQDSDNVSITVEKYRPINTKLTTPDLSVNLRESFTLTCSSQANPPAKYRFYRGTKSLFNTTVGNNTAVNTTSVSERIPQVIYSCTPFNDLYGDGPTDTITVTVHYPPERTNYNQAVRVPVNTSATLSCPVDGNPEPDITWYEGNDTSGTLLQSGKDLNFPKATSSKSGWYACFANNSLNPPVLARLRLLVELIKPSTLPKTTPNELMKPSTTPQTTPNEPVCKETFIKDKNCSIIAWKIVVLALAGVVVIAFVVGIVGWWVHKKRKCRKDPRIHHSEERPHGNVEDNAYSQVKHGYAGTGLRTNGTGAVALQQRAAADGRDAASHQQEATASPTYAEVDKSKKKKKEEKLDYTYAEVDKSKKSKKKPKPGEMIYADLEDINGPRPMPTVSTSPQPQAPIKRPEPYENTPYADITQFLKGDATLPQSDSNQGTELQPQGASKDEGGAGGEDRNTTM